jgi:hypothetical protein
MIPQAGLRSGRIDGPNPIDAMQLGSSHVDWPFRSFSRLLGDCDCYLWVGDIFHGSRLPDFDAVAERESEMEAFVGSYDPFAVVIRQQPVLSIDAYTRIRILT